MPKVGNKEFSYDMKGMKKAKAMSKKMGMPMNKKMMPMKMKKGKS